MDILIYNDIGDMSYWDDDPNAIDGKWMAEQLALVPANELEVNVRINSPGGLCSEGITIRNQMRTFAQRRRLFNADFKLNTIVDGFAYSAAFTIALGGDKMIVNKGALCMCHEAFCYSAGNSREFIKTAAYLALLDSELSELMSARTKKTAKDMMLLIEAETYMTAEDCLALGICDDIGDTLVTNFGKYEDVKNIKPGEYQSTVRQRMRDRTAKNRANLQAKNEVIKPTIQAPPDTSWIDYQVRDIALQRILL